MSQFSAKEYKMIRQWVFNLTAAIPLAERQEQRLPITPEDVSTISMAMFSEVTDCHRVT